MRKKLTGCIVACALLLCGAVATMRDTTKTALAAAAEKSWDWTNDYQSTSRSGQTYTGTKVELSTESTYQWVYTVGYSTFSIGGTVAELQEGLLFQCLPNEANTNWATDLVVTFKDSKNADLQVSYIISGGNIPGVSMYTLYTTKGVGWERKDGYGYWTDSTYNDSTSPKRIPVNSHDAHKANELGVKDYDKNEYKTIFCKDGATNTTALKFAVKSDGVYFQGTKKSEIADSSLFTSGNVLAELTFINFTYLTQSIGAGAAVNMISFGSRSLAKIKEGEPPKIELDSPYYDSTMGAFVFEKGREYRFSDLKSKIAKATDNVDKNSTIDLEVYNAQNVKYTVGETISFTDGDYFKIIAQDCNGNKAELKTNALSLFTVDIPQKVYAELQAEAVRYGVLTSLPSGYGYTTALYEKTDGEHESPLTEESLYEFDDVGGYVVAFHVYNDELSVRTYFVELEVVDKTAPVMNFEKEYEAEYSVNERVKLLRPELSDNNKNGSPTLAMKAYFGGNEVAVTDDAIVLNQIGTYEIEYTATDKSGNISVERKAVVNRGNDFLAPTIVLNGEYKNSYTVGSKIKLVAATVTDNVDASPVVKVEVVLNGKLLTEKDGSVKPNEAGTLYVVYTAVDESGNQSTHIVQAETVAKKSGCKGSVSSTVGVVGLGVAVASLLKKRKEKKDEK